MDFGGAGHEKSSSMIDFERKNMQVHARALAIDRNRYLEKLNEVSTSFTEMKVAIITFKFHGTIVDKVKFLIQKIMK